MQIRFFGVGCGDGIHIHFIGNDGFPRNIMIDGGVENGDIYPNTLQKAIQEISRRDEKIDLWIITHIDDDHIGGVLRFLKDEPLRKNIDLTQTQFWFNYSIWDYNTGLGKSNLRSVKQGMRLRDFLLENSKLEQSITDATSRVDFFGVTITLLSPNKAKYDQLISKWQKEEIKIRGKQSSRLKISQKNDYSIQIKGFDLTQFEEDGSEENGSSIAFLLEYQGEKIMFLADSHPTMIKNSLERLGYSQTNKIELAYMQVAHHGSKHNTHNALLELIDCKKFIISADGFNKHNLPNKETLVRIAKKYPNNAIQFFITHKNQLTTSIFDVDGKNENIQLEFPLPDTTALLFQL